MLAAGIGMTAIMLLGAALLPILRFTRATVANELVGGSSPTATAATQRLRQVLLGSHVCATIIVLLCAGLFVRAVSRGLGDGPGFDVARTVFVTVQTLSPTRNITSLDAELVKINGRGTRVSDVLRSLAGVDDFAQGLAPVGPDQASALLTPYAVHTDGEQRSVPTQGP